MRELSTPGVRGRVFPAPDFAQTRFQSATLRIDNSTACRNDLAQCRHGKGLGAVAVRDIMAGERLASEAPLVTSDGISTHGNSCSAQTSLPVSRLAKLSANDRLLFSNLSQSEVFGKQKTIAGIFATNAIPFWDSSDGEHAGIFPTIARFNHSCSPSAAYTR